MKGESYMDFTRDGAWCFFADPRAVHYTGLHNRTYIGWLTREGDVMIGTYDHQNDTIDSMLIKKSLQEDDHANPSLYIAEDGRVTIYYSAHGGPDMYYRTMATPEDITSFDIESTLPVNTEGAFGYTYPNPVYLNNEKLHYLFWRGGNFKPNFSTSTDGVTWSESRTLISGDGGRPYIKYAAQDDDTIWFAFTDGHPNAEATNSIYCAAYSDGRIHHADGSIIRTMSDLPMLPKEADLVYDAANAGGKTWIWDIAMDHDGHPALVYAVFISDTDHRYYYSHWNGKSWDNHEITACGSWFPQTPDGVVETEPYYSGGIILDHQDPSNVYLSRSVNGVFEIEHWHTPDFGTTWTSTAITSGSSNNNVRPYLSRSGDNEPAVLLWMNGEYIHYTQYRTSLKMKLVR